jgi:hypothetical protein
VMQSELRTMHSLNQEPINKQLATRANIDRLCSRDRSRRHGNERPENRKFPVQCIHIFDQRSLNSGIRFHDRRVCYRFRGP